MTSAPFASPPRRQRVGAYGLIRRDGAVLLCRMSASSRSPGRWTLPGGGLHHGENPVQAVLRELREETGLTGQVGSLLGVHSNVYKAPATGAEIHGIRLIYAMTAAGSLRPAFTGSTDGAGWIDAATVAGLDLSDHARYALDLGR